MKRAILVLLLLVVLQKANAQFYENPILNKISLNVNAGTQGAGAEFRYGALSSLALRVGGNFIPVTAENLFQLPGIASSNRVSVQFSNVHLLADYTPFKAASFIRLVGGAAYFMQADGGVEVQPTSSYNYNDVTVSKDQIGKLNMNVSWKGVAPYMGIGLFRSFPRRAFNVNLDLGTYYLQQPGAQIIGTGLLSGNSTQTAQFQDNIKGYRWLPVVQVNFNFKLN